MNNNSIPSSLENERGFKGVFVPSFIWVHAELSPLEKMLLMEIDSLDNDELRGCFASDEYFGQFLRMSEGRIANLISSLRKRNFLQKVWSNGRQRGLRLHVDVKAECLRLHAKVKAEFTLRGKQVSRRREHIIDSIIDNNIIEEKESVPPEIEKILSPQKKPKKEKAPRLRRTPRSSPELTGADYIALLAARAESERMENLVPPSHPDPAESGVDRNIDPAGWATELAVKFMQENTATVDSWISKAKATHLPTPESIESDIRLFFGHYQGKNGRSHSCYNTPVFYFQANYFNWIVMGVQRDRENKERAAQNAKRGQSNQNGNSDFNNRRSNTTINNLTC